METLPLAEVRANLSKLVDEAVRTHLRIEVTRQGRRASIRHRRDAYRT
ncbi:MAG: type II toxin-antitoxin system Phd/YefM family antitoxin [Mycobacterium sp.]|nr:type II toxin-antitoxin system Phd/YefM family antitoxin [Mycobacterium sp.]